MEPVMKRQVVSRAAALAVLATAFWAGACGERASGTRSLLEPSLRGPSRDIGGAPTVWDFVQLAGGDGPQGMSHTFTISGVGSIVTSTPLSNPLSQINTKGFE